MPLFFAEHGAFNEKTLLLIKSEESADLGFQILRRPHA
jgi:hypothetical protein